MARMYSNENIPILVVHELWRLGHDVLTSQDAGQANSAVPDHEVLAFAAAEDRILLSHDRKHFLRLHQNRASDHAGLILCTFDADFRRQAARIDASLANTSDMRNQVLRVNRPG